jgi:hypothetical protein
MFRRIVRQGSLVAVLLAVTASVAIAAPGGRSSSNSSISLVVLSSSTTGTATVAPSYGQAVTFATSTDATTQPYVHLKCSQNGSLVLEAWRAWFVGPQSFTLASGAWQGGAADCTAYLENWDSYSKNGKTSVLASTDFHVNA